MWHELGTISIWNRICQYQLAPSGDTNEAAKDPCDMARVVDSAIYMIDWVITHMLIQSEIIELSC